MYEGISKFSHACVASASEHKIMEIAVFISDNILGISLGATQIKKTTISDGS